MFLGLLPLLKSIHKHGTLKKFSGQTIGVDAYGWLHRGVVGCALALALDKPTTIHIDFVLSRVRMLLDFGVTPYLVFDGDNLPSKAGTNEARRKRRDESKAMGLQLHKAGKTAQAHQELQKAVDVTPLMARQLIDELKKLNVQYIVAPYEADAQLVYLEQKGIIDGILSEDSDLLVFGAKRLLTKLNQYGELVEVDRADFASCKEINLAGWTDTMFRRMAILSGCDYLSNIGKMGLKTAHAHVRKNNDIEKIIRIVQFEGKLIVPKNYLEDFRHAELTFLHHRVFCPRAQRMVFLNDLPPGMLESDMPYLGPYVAPDTAIGVACGDLDPFSKKPIHTRSGKHIGRPALGEMRRQTYASAEDLKPKKPLETFFKPHRQPLAELDPNSLTPSPSQQQLLRRNQNASWEPRLVSSAPGLTRSMTTSARRTDGTDRTAFLARASTMSTYQPPKRQRLCADTIDPSPTRGLKQSPFFSVIAEEPSPLAQKTTRTAAGKKPMFEIYPDVNADGKKAGPEIQQLASPDRQHDMKSHRVTKGQSAQHLEPHSTVPQSPRVAESPTHIQTPLLEKSSPSRRPSNRASPMPAATKEVSQNEDPEAFEDLLEYHVQKQNESLMKTFAFQPRERQVSALQSLATTKAQQSTSSAEPPVRRMAASERLSNINSVQVSGRVSVQTTFCRQPPEIQQSALRSLNTKGSGRDISSGERKGPTGSRKCAAAMSEESPNHAKTKNDRSLSGLNGRRDVQGSEDAMVPNSEDEISEVGSPPETPRINLRAFAFVSA